MPVMQCAGAAGCGRMISISAVPGGNPAAVADPEGFASEWTFCGQCRGYTCDRCLGRQHGHCRCGTAARLLSEPERIQVALAIMQGRQPAGAGAIAVAQIAPAAQPSGAAAFAAAMGASHAPSGGVSAGAAAFNAAMGGGAAIAPGAMAAGAMAAGAMGPAASGTVERTGPRYSVRARGNSFAWPSACVCCGERTDQTRTLSDTQQSGRTRTTMSWPIPCCAACSGHLSPFYPLFEPPGANGVAMDPSQVKASPAEWGKAAGIAFLIAAVVAWFGNYVASIVLGFPMFLPLFALVFGVLMFRSYLAIQKKVRLHKGWADNPRKNAEGRARHIALGRPTCTHTAQGAFKYDLQGADHVFIFSRRELAQAFARANGSAVVSSDA